MPKQANGSGPWSGWNAADWTAIGALLAVGWIARAAYLEIAGLTRFDPWRHLALVRQLREGHGFTLYGDQPYLWYGPTWYWLCSLVPESVPAEWPATVLSLASVALLYALVRGETAGAGGSRRGAATAGLLAAVCGPMIAFTCHLGSEALALALALASLLLCGRSRGACVAAFAGAAFGLAVVLRMNFAFLALLALPGLARPARLAAFALGGAIPVAAAWLRNHAILATHAYVFTWDGLAIPSDGFDALSTLVLQRQPDVAAALRRLHEHTMPLPEWLRGPGGTSWELMLLMASGLAAVALSRRAGLVAATVAMLGYFLAFDATLTSNHFRLYLPLLPVFFIAAGRLAAGDARRRRLAWALAVLLVAAGVGSFRSSNTPPLEAVTPPPELLVEDAFMVASGFFQPDSLAFRFPAKRFIGMPLDPERLEDFRARFPEYRTILWHGLSVQQELGRRLRESPDYAVIRTGVNSAGRRYAVLAAKSSDGSAAPPARTHAGASAGSSSQPERDVGPSPQLPAPGAGGPTGRQPGAAAGRAAP